jgi:hypothetical protein
LFIARKFIRWFVGYFVFNIYSRLHSLCLWACINGLWRVAMDTISACHQ